MKYTNFSMDYALRWDGYSIHEETAPSGFDDSGYAEAIKPYNDAMAEAGVTMTVKSGAPFQEWNRGMWGYTVTLRYRGRSMTIPFYMGKLCTQQPTVAEVVHSLGVDLSCAYETFDEYADEFLNVNDRDDETMKEARRTWRACVKQSEKTKRLFGDETDAILEKVADL